MVLFCWIIAGNKGHRTWSFCNNKPVRYTNIKRPYKNHQPFNIIMACAKPLFFYCQNLYTLLIFMCTLCSASLPKLLLISMDGFRYDYLDLIPPEETEHFQYMIKNGVKAKAVMNAFPANTYPNHYTLITGLYPESHGIVHNQFYDSYWNEFFDYSNKRDNVDPLWYDVGAEPIYVTNKKAGGYSGSLVWPTGIGKVKGVQPDRLVPHADSWTEMNSTERVETLIRWFTDKKNPINLGLMYFLEPDETAHHTGAGSTSVKDLIKGELNDALGYLFQRLKDVDLFDEMNIILTADHGFTNYSKEKAVVLDKYLNSSLYKTGVKQFLGDYIVHVFPEKGQEDFVYKALSNISNMTTYKKEDKELVRLHHSNNERIAPIILIASGGGCIFPDEESRDAMKTVGVHGYNPYMVPDMRPFFIAMGPAFKKGYVSEQFNSVDIYPLMCHILGIEPAPNNGSFQNVKGLLAPKDESITDKLTVTWISFLNIVGLSVTFAAVYAICAFHNARYKPRPLLPSNNRASGFTPLGQTSQKLLNSEDEDDF